MAWKPGYPNDFASTLKRTFSDDEVADLLSKSSCSPRFVYGVLMLPTVLKYTLDLHQSVDIDMTHAILSGYKLYQFSETSPPVIAPSSDPRAVVEGVLIFGLNEQQRNTIYEFEGGLTHLVDVQVKICQTDICDRHEMKCARAVDAGTFVWRGPKDGLIPMNCTSWPLDDFLKSPFYESIVRSQRRQSLDESVRSGDIPDPDVILERAPIGGICAHRSKAAESGLSNM